MSGLDSQRMRTWIRDYLAADATLIAAAPGGVHDGTAPPGTAYPLVELSDAGNSTTRGNGGFRVLVNAVVLVKVIAPEHYFETIRTAAERVDTLLDGISTASAQLIVFDIGRDSEHYASYTEDGDQYVEAGGFYRCICRST